MPYKKKDILDKYNKIEQDGKKALEKGTITPFTGFDISLKRRMNVSFLPDQKTIDSVVERIVTPLQTVAQQLGIGLLGARINYPVHVALQEAISEATGDIDAIQTFESMRESVILTKNFVGSALEMNRLIMDGNGNVILAAEAICDSICSMRSTLAQSYAQQGLRSLPLDNILHSTMTRIATLPDEDDEVQYKIWEFSQQVKRIEIQIKNSPIDFCVGGIYTGNTLDLLTK